jgi:hypothetical protein
MAQPTSIDPLRPKLGEASGLASDVRYLILLSLYVFLSENASLIDGAVHYSDLFLLLVAEGDADRGLLT